MKVRNLVIALAVSIKKIAELQRKIKSFESLTETLAKEVDRQRRENETLRLQQKPQRSNSFLKTA